MLSMLNGVASTTASQSLNTIETTLNMSPSTGLQSLTGTEPWNSTDSGFMWIRAIPTDLSATSEDQYLMDLNDGDSNPSSGLRIRESDGDEFGQRYRDENGNIVSGNLDKGRVIAKLQWL